MSIHPKHKHRTLQHLIPGHLHQGLRELLMEYFPASPKGALIPHGIVQWPCILAWSCLDSRTISQTLPSFKGSINLLCISLWAQIPLIIDTLCILVLSRAGSCSSLKEAASLKSGCFSAAHDVPKWIHGPLYILKHQDKRLCALIKGQSHQWITSWLPRAGKMQH